MNKYSTGFKKMNCRECGEIVEKVDVSTAAVTCWRCVINMMGGLAQVDEQQEEVKKCSKKS